tara:strand:+ start:377 stop:718 length:342 start_codon:yes stop_codon:yes gene_type:complete
MKDCPKRFSSLTIKELKVKLKKKKLPVSGTKIELCMRLMQKRNSSMVKIRNLVKRKCPPTSDSEFKFYVSLFCQNPQSMMAKEWIEKHNVTEVKINTYCKRLMKSKKKGKEYV